MATDQKNPLYPTTRVQERLIVEYESGFSRCGDWFRLSSSEANPKKAADMPSGFTTQSVIIRREHDEEFFATSEIRFGDDIYATFGPTYWKGKNADYGHNNTMNYHVFSASGLYCPLVIKPDGRGISTPRYWPGYDGYCFVAERCEEIPFHPETDKVPATHSKISFVLAEIKIMTRVALFQREPSALFVRFAPIPFPPELVRRIVEEFNLRNYPACDRPALLFGRLDFAGRLQLFFQFFSPEGSEYVSGSVDVSQIALICHRSDWGPTVIFD